MINRPWWEDPKADFSKARQPGRRSVQTSTEYPSEWKISRTRTAHLSGPSVPRAITHSFISSPSVPLSPSIPLSFHPSILHPSISPLSSPLHPSPHPYLSPTSTSVLPSLTLSVLPSSWMDCPQSQLSLSSDPVDTEVRSAPIVSLFLSISPNLSRSLIHSLYLSGCPQVATSVPRSEVINFLWRVMTSSLYTTVA